MQKHRIRCFRRCVLQLSLIVSVCVLTSLSCNLFSADPSGGSESPLMDFLHYIPDTSEYRQYLSYGNAANWYAAWEIARPESVQALLDSNPETEKPYLLNLLPRQTTPPFSLRTEFMITEDRRGLLGFDLINLDRYLETGEPPRTITVVEFSFDHQQIADALTGLGYQAQEMSDGVLYHISGDNLVDLKSPIRTNQMANLNRILLLDDKMIIGSATDVVQISLLPLEASLHREF